MQKKRIPSVNTHFYKKRMQDKQIKIKEVEVPNQQRDQVKKILLTPTLPINTLIKDQNKNKSKSTDMKKKL